MKLQQKLRMFIALFVMWQKKCLSDNRRKRTRTTYRRKTPKCLNSPLLCYIISFIRLMLTCFQFQLTSVSGSVRIVANKIFCFTIPETKTDLTLTMNFKSRTIVQNISHIILLFTIFFSNIESVQALSAKNTELLRKGVQPKVLGNPIEDDEAFATVYDGPEDSSTAPGCPERTFQLPWIYYGNPERCYLAGHRGPCNSRMTMFVRQSEPIRGMCDCDDAGSFTTSESYFLAKNKTFCIHEKRRLAYFPPKKRCYYLFERGPCPFGEWLIINGQGNAVCEVRRCPKNLYDTTSYRTPFWFYDNLRDSCYQAYTRGYCPRNHLLLPTKTNWLPQCTNTKVKCDDLLPAVVAIPTLRCSPGSYCAQMLDGRKHYTRSKISRRHRDRT